MKKIKRVLILVFLWGILVALVCVLPWRDRIGQQFQHPITLTSYVLTILFWSCIAISFTTKKWLWAIGSAVTACALAIMKVVT